MIVNTSKFAILNFHTVCKILASKFFYFFAMKMNTMLKTIFEKRNNTLFGFKFSFFPPGIDNEAI